jgi:glycosyltransferase involved in cell wall biosynthesis
MQSPTSPRVALVMVVVGDLAGSGGSERLFADLHSYFAARPESDVTLVTASASLARLREARPLTGASRVIALDLGSRPGRGKVGVTWMTMRLLAVTLRGRFDVVHVCLPSPIYVPYLAALRLLPRRWRPSRVATVIDCTLARSMEHAPPHGTYERQVLDSHRLYQRWAKLDGLYSWYRAFIDAASLGRDSAGPLLRAARFCFTDPIRFRPAREKEKLVVFAGRFSEQKRPLLFVDAVARLVGDEPELVRGWRFEMYGQGSLAREVAERIAARRLSGFVTVTRAIDMAPVFARGRLFVSTQAFENFTSLAMLEAMSAGNAVIAEDVGQTREFVRDGENGHLVVDASPEAFAAAIAAYLRHPDRHDAMADASRALVTRVHTIEHFAEDVLAFWGDVAWRS